MPPSLGPILPCAICGQGRYDHDVVRVPKIHTVRKLAEWVSALGAQAMDRLQSRYKKPAYACVEHFDTVITVGQNEELFSQTMPRSIPKEELELIENVFHDHWCSDLYKKRTNCFNPLSILLCSMCSDHVRRNDMASHAETHLVFPSQSEHLCENHAQELELPKQDERHWCGECSAVRSRAHIDSWKAVAERCFPMFEFVIISFPVLKKVVYALDWKLRMAYAESRKSILDNPGLQESLRLETPKTADSRENEDVTEIPGTLNDLLKIVTSDCEAKTENSASAEEITKEVKLEPIDSYEMTEASETDEQCNISGITDLFNTLKEIYPLDKHPSLATMIKMVETAGNGCDLRTIFEFYDEQRALDEESCANDDNCGIIREFLANENAPNSEFVLDETMRNRMYKAFDEFILPGKQFTIGNSYLLSRKIGLSPRQLRTEFNAYRRKCKMEKECQDSNAPEEQSAPELQKTSEVTLDKEEKCDLNSASDCEMPGTSEQSPEMDDDTDFEDLDASCNNPTPLRQKRGFTQEQRELLEEEFLNIMKEHQLDRRFHQSQFTSISERTNLTQIQVMRWMNTKRGRVLESPWRRHSYTDRERQVLMEHFKKNPKPLSSEHNRLAELLNLTPVQVRRFFERQRKVAVVKSYETELAAIPKEKCEVLERAQRKTSVKTRRQLAEQLDLPYNVVTRWLESRSINHKNGKWRERVTKLANVVDFYMKEAAGELNEVDSLV